MVSIYWGKFFKVNIPILSKSIISFLEPKRSSNTTKARLQKKKKIKKKKKKLKNKKLKKKKKKKKNQKEKRLEKVWVYELNYPSLILIMKNNINNNIIK